ncbi:TPR-like protein [Histomonas meleagridis]|uniref:TPR-like protein n=1 Tax=Histomonas meleagridis TaxID=135588 RepID=UPI00355A817C|nr:TPR-like protein [Histomonas meleagridis]KAH0805151.1 TPR-like protein [Histomonas meleagridis]
MISTFAKSKFPKDCPPFLQTARSLEFLFKNQLKEAVLLAREVDKLQPTNEQILDIISLIFSLTNKEKDKYAIFSRESKRFPNKLEVTLEFLYLNLSMSKFAEAQLLAMSIAKQILTDSSYMIVAMCCYLRAYQETPAKSPPFFKFTVSFLDKVKTPNVDLAIMKVNSLIELKNYQQALDYLNDESIKKLLDFDHITYNRLKIKANLALGNTDEVAQIAESFLREINSDSLDEWKLVVKYHKDAEKVINDLANPKFRGHRLARIELYLQQKKDITPLIEEYISTFANRPFVFGDLKPYFTDEVLSKLYNCQDTVIQTFATNKFNVDKIDTPKLASILAEDAIRQNDTQKMLEAVNVCSEFETKCDSRIALIRLSGLLGLTVYQNKLWHQQKLEGINYLSLSSIYLNDHIRSWDFKSLTKQLNSTDDFVIKSLQSFDKHLQKSAKTQSYLVVKDAISFKGTIVNNLTKYTSYIINLWFKMLKDINIVCEYYPEEFLEDQLVDTLEERIDYSVLPIYFNDDTLKDKIYPSIRNLINVFDPIVKTLFYIKLNPSKVNEQINRIQNNKEWKLFVDFIQTGKVGDIEDDVNIYVIGSIAIAKKLLNNKENIKDKLMEKLKGQAEKLKDKINYQNLPQNIMDTIETQKNNIDEAVKEVEEILQ